MRFVISTVFRAGRRVRTWAIRRARRSPFWPPGTPDKCADVDRLGKPFPGAIIVFFPGGRDNLYQLLPWLPALERLDAAYGVTLVFRDSRMASEARAASAIDCVTLSSIGQLDAILALSDIKLALYLNHSLFNFECLRFPSLVHVYLGHGDSDKAVSVSNQVKAYDYCFLAGQGALDRTAAGTMLYDAAGHSVLIGQPQLSDEHLAPDLDPSRQTVLYAPTWESSQPSMCYSSLRTQGLRLAKTLRGSYRFIYRPHPAMGALDPAFARADAEVRAVADRVDVGVPLERSFADADLLISDVSAIVLSWLPTGKPVIVTTPRVGVPRSRVLDVVPPLPEDADPAAIVAAQLAHDQAKDARSSLVEYYFGDTTPGVAVTRFIEACGELITLRDQQWSAAMERGAIGP